MPFRNPVFAFRDAARLSPDKIAVIDNHAQFTYVQLANLSNAIARAIQNAGVEKQFALVLLENGANLIAAMVGVTTTGNPNCLVDATLPIEMIEHIRSTVNAEVLITTQEQKHRLINLLPEIRHWIIIEELDISDQPEPPIIEPAPNQTFVVFFTSGSTGKPKGISISYQSYLYRIYQDRLTDQFGKDDVLALLVSLVFIRPIKSVWLGLGVGATIALTDLNGISINQVLEWLESIGATYAQISSRFGEKLYDFLAQNSDLPLSTLRMMDVGGEKLSPTTLQTFLNAKHLNHQLRYSIGASETSTYFDAIYDHHSKFDPEMRFTNLLVGSLIAIQTEDGSIANRNAKGEILVASIKLFDGYLNGPVGSEIFIYDNIVPGGKFFKTGDLGDLDDQGNLGVVGRKDSMVKVRGYRIDLGEVTSSLRSNPRIQDAYVNLTANRRGEKLLTAWILFKPGSDCTITELKKDLLQNLVTYKLPQRFIVLEEMPYGPAGKVDPHKLPASLNRRPNISTAFVAPSAGTEQELADIWQEVLDLDSCGCEDNFFELGGDSINILELINVVEDRYHVRIPSVFIDNPTIRAMASLIKDANHSRELSRESEGRREIFNENRTSMHRKKYEDKFWVRWLGLVTEKLTWKQLLSKIRWLSNNSIFGSTIMAPYKSWYNQWLDVTGYPDRILSYQKFVFATLLNLLPKTKFIKSSEEARSILDLSKSSIKFYRSFAKEIMDTPPRTSPVNFPIEGFDHFLKALDSKKPVFLISTHGNIRFETRPTVEYLAGIQPIVTITHNRGVAGKYGLGREKTDPLTRHASNAGVTIDALGYVAQGRVLAFYGDTIDPLTKNYSFNLLGKPYDLKSGFAEIGLSVDAQILPMFTSISDDFKVVINFLPPLIADGESYEERIQNLTKQYADFIEKMWREHPETMYIARIKKHIRGLKNQAD